MPITYGRPRPPSHGIQPSAEVINHNPSSSPTELEFHQDWKQKLKDIDNDEYDGEMVHEATSSSLTPLVSSSSLTPLPESQPRRSSPSKEYRDSETDDPDTSVELNTTIAMPSSDGELVPEREDAESDDEPVVSKRMTKPLRVVDSDEETDSKQSASQMSLDKLVKSSNPTTPASSGKKPIKLALSDDSDDDQEEEQEDIQDASSPQVRRSMKKGLNKAEKVEMAKTQQAIAATREIRIPNATKRVDAKSFFSNYHATVNQAEIDSYPFPPGPKSQRPTDSKVRLRDKVAALRPLSSAPVPQIQHQVSSDPIIGSSQTGQAPITNDDDNPQPKGLFGKPNALGMSMFGGGDSDDEDLPPVNQVLFSAKPKPKPKQLGLEEKKRALAAQKIDLDSDDDLEIAGGSRPVNSRILARPGQKLVAARQKIKPEVSESQVFRAGHANHFGLDAAPSSSPVKGGGQYEESQFGRGLLPGSSKPKSVWAGVKLTQPAARGKNNERMSMEQLKRFAAGKAVDDGQARQKADEKRWVANGGRVLKKDKGKEDGVGVEDAVREALERTEQPEGEEEEEEDESDEEYRGSASEQSEEEEDKENLPAAGRSRKPHEPVSDFDGSEKGEGDEDKENSLELVGVGSGLSPARIDGTSPGLGARSPAQLNGLSPGMSPRLVAPSPSRPFGRSPSHLRLSSGSGRLPLGELEDEDKVPGENAAVARAPLGELDVHEEEEEVVRRPMKRPRKGVVEDEDEETGTPRRKPSSLSQRRLDSPSQRKLPLSLSSPSQRLLSSPSQRLRSPSLRFGSPTPRAQRSRLATGTQSFSQVEPQDMGGLGDVFGFESQAAPAGSPSGGLTQLFANSTGAGPSDAFAALRANSNNIELTQDERSKLLYKPKISEEEARRDQELFEREDGLMAQPFSPTQKEKDTQMWLNEQGLWTPTKPAQTQIVRSLAEDPSSTPVKMATTSLGTPSPSASPSSHTLQRIRRGAPSAQESTPEPEPVPAPIPSVLERLMATQREKQKKDKRKSKLARSEFVEGEAAESDDEYEGFGLRSKDDEGDDGDSDEDRHVEGLVDDQAMDEDTEAAAQVQAKFMEQNALEDEAREKLAREVVTGKLRTRRRRGDNMDLDEDEESEDEHRRGPKNFLKKRKIDNDHLDALAKHESTRAFVNMYDKAIKSVEDDEFSHLNQITEDIDVAPETNEEEDGEGEDEDEDGGEDEPETPFGHAKKYIPSSEKAEVSFGFKPTGFNYGDDSEDEDPATVDLPDAIPQKQAPLVRGNSTNTRVQQWAAQEGSGPRINLGRMGQGVSVTGHTSKSKITKTKSVSSNRTAALAATSSTSSNRLSRLGSKADGFR